MRVIRKIGFSGTREGMTEKQKESFKSLIPKFCDMSEFHHGCCIGSDYDALKIVKAINKKPRIVAHPPKNKSLTFDYSDADEILEEKDYLARNIEIIKKCDLLIATPKDEIKKGGTWFTINNAIKIGLKVKIIWPNGSVSDWSGIK